ncbi:MAG: xanthine dehydrogenase family protein molybdopterin-binding subunit [Treponema sp.]|jgi:CO/xanthine dehydrogenase Mo-binding subunit|nr:xanthine dehydrogenase family protein molybdopterin-binding subunit [Treponema sp.]
MDTRPLFVGDTEPEGVLYGITIRSPIARGALISLECPKLPASYTLVRSTDIPGKNNLDEFSLPVLAAESLSYIGEPVALLIGPDPVKVEKLAGQIRVITGEELPNLYPHAVPEGAVLARRDIAAGETADAFKEAAAIVEGTYTTGIQDHWYSEPAGAVAVWKSGKEDRGRITVHTATQWPFQVLRSVANVLNFPRNRVTVAPSAIGIHLDGKLWYPSLLACHAALGAFITKKPVKILLSRIEDFRYSPKRNGAEIRIRSALGNRGQLLATEISVLADLGAYGVFTDEILDRTCLGSLGSYKPENIRIQGQAVSTNIPPAGPFAGFGMAQGFFAMERHVSAIADILHQDPMEWRMDNIPGKKRLLAIGAPVSDAIPAGLLDTAAAMGDYRRKWASYEMLREYRRQNGKAAKYETLRGIGIATAYQGSGLLYPGNDRGVYDVELTLDKEGTLEIRTGMVASNDEYVYIWRKIAAEVLSIEAGDIRVVSGNTALGIDSGPATLSRNITAVTRLVERACMALRKQRFRDPLPITVRRSCRPVKKTGWTGVPFDENVFTRLAWGVAVVETEIDPIAFIPKIRGVWLGIDGGKILSEERARRSLKFSVIQALGWASREAIGYTEGRIPDHQFDHYDIPAPQDIPPIHIDFIWNDTVHPKGIGELPFHCVPAAFVQAVSQAADYPFNRIPLTARDVWDAKKLKTGEEDI